ncbi:MAG: septal ring lytic transglycosylase RlpA family protein [Pseudomonas sp.]|uniref:septal ring lytic transglycosylase RlpA family protein n=1 Tax=Pseudomonas sp. TaxID=306 RepID=UPI003393CB0B
MCRAIALPLIMLGVLSGCAGQSLDGYDAEGRASYYGGKHQGKRTASGEKFDLNALTAAHRELPFGTQVLVTNLLNQKTVVVRINDRGPHNRSRLIDLSQRAAQQLDMLRSGVAPVRVQRLAD